MGCGGASPTPQVQIHVLPRSSSSGKGRPSLPVSKQTVYFTKLIRLLSNFQHGVSCGKGLSLCILHTMIFDTPVSVVQKSSQSMLTYLHEKNKTFLSDSQCFVCPTYKMKSNLSVTSPVRYAHYSFTIERLNKSPHPLPTVSCSCDVLPSILIIPWQEAGDRRKYESAEPVHDYRSRYFSLIGRRLSPCAGLNYNDCGIFCQNLYTNTNLVDNRVLRLWAKDLATLPR